MGPAGGWEQGRVDRPIGPQALLISVVAALPVALVGVGLLHLVAQPAQLASQGEAIGGLAAGSSADVVPELREQPASRTGLGWLHLGDPLHAAEDVLGPPQHQQPDINATVTYTWSLPDGGRIAVTGDHMGIAGLYAEVPAGATPVHAHGGVVVGRSALGEVIERWGEPEAVGVRPGDDFALRYVECADGWPVVVKIDQDRRGGHADRDAPITSLLIAYADADPDGCGAELAHR